MAPVIPRLIGDEIRWVGCQYPTPALAQEAGMTLRQFEDFLYGACLLDWEAMRRDMQRIAERFDAAETVRVVGPGTDIAFSLAGRRGKVDALGANMPGGEVFYSPVEDSAEGVVDFCEYPTTRDGRELSGVRLRFEGGRIVEATAAMNEEYLNKALDTDEGARAARRVRDRLQPGHPAAHEEHALRREDRGHGALRRRRRLPAARRDERVDRSLGHGQGPARRRRDLVRRRAGAGRREVADLSDPRIAEYATLIVDRCIGVQPGWTVQVRATPLARPLVEELQAEIARRGAYAHLALSFELYGGPWALEAPLELLGEPSPVQRAVWEGCDAFITVWAPENTRDGADLSAERKALLEQASTPLRKRTMSMAAPWTICEYPTNATAQDAGMTLRQLEDFLFGACLLDWDAEERRLRTIADRFDAAREVRIVGDGTDVRISIDGREGSVDDGRVNMPGGEVFYSPIETDVEGVVSFSEFPAVYYGREVVGARLRFEGGRIVDATAAEGEDFLVATLDTDEGARRLGELGIGANPGIQRYTKNVGFDEKIDGTVHLAVGKAYEFNGGTNESAVHWDLVKDLRTPGSRIECDGEVVQAEGRWQI